MLKKRYKILTVILVLLSLFVSVSVYAANRQVARSKAGCLPYASFSEHNLSLTWTGNPETTQTITWSTSTKNKKGYVQYVLGSDPKAFNKSPQNIIGNKSLFNSDTGKMNVFTATLSYLQPGTKYLYRVGDGKNWSNIHAFSTETAGTSNFKFLIFGDSQSVGKYPLWKSTIQNAFKAEPTAKFFVNVGDLVDSGSSYTHWSSWFNGASGVIDAIPAMVVRGNHDSNKQYWTSMFKLPKKWSG